MKTKEELQERAQLVRIHEANCAIQFPTATEANFRLAIMKALAADLGLKELRGAVIEGPAVSDAAAKPLRRPDKRQPDNASGRQS